MTMRISKDRIDMDDNVLQKPVLRDYGESLVGGASGTNTTSSYTIDLHNGNVFNLILNANCAFTFSNPPASGVSGGFTLMLAQDGTGGRTVTWPAAVKWGGGTAPSMPGTASAKRTFSFFTMDGGTTWYGFASEIQQSLSIVGISWNNDSTSFTYPSGTAVGDLVVLIDHAHNTASPGIPASVTPSGFTSLGNASHSYGSSGVRITIWRHVITSTTAPTGMSALQMTKCAVVARPAKPITTVTSPAWSPVSSLGDPASSSTGGGGVSGPLIAIGYTGSNSASGLNFGTESPAFASKQNNGASANLRSIAGYTIYNTTGTSHTVDIGDLNDANATAAGYIKIA